MSGASAKAQGRAARDERLDMARGLTMAIIFVAHVPANSWADYIPARMGFSSGAEAFVLCSGLACGLAFGGAYGRFGWLEGTRRVLRRIAQLWAAQVLAFLAFAGVLLWVDRQLGATTNLTRYDLAYLVEAPVDAVASLATLRYVPAYFDILPLYVALLAALPVMVALARRWRSAPIFMSGAIWLLAQFWPHNLTAHPLTGREWYFNPLAWQFLFFLGFGASAGWIRVPAATPGRVRAVLAILLACVPLTFWAFHGLSPSLDAWRADVAQVGAITALPPTRLMHVLLIAWAFAAILASRRATLGHGVSGPFVLIGQQSLITFLTGVFLSALAGVALDQTGRDPIWTAIVNVAGVAGLLLAAQLGRAVKARMRRKRAIQPIPFPSPDERHA